MDLLFGNQTRALGRIRQLTDAAGESGRGQVVFLFGPSGCGKSHLLGRIAEDFPLEVSGARLVSSRRPGDADVGPPKSGGDAPFANALETLVSAAASASIAHLSPALEVLSQTLALSEAARELADDLRAPRGDDGRVDLFEPLLGAAAREEPERPLVCLVDDAEWLGAEWWLNLQFSFAATIGRELPLVLVLAVTSPDEGYGEGAIFGRAVAESLVERRLAESLFLQPLTSDEISSVLGPMAPSLAAKLREASGGFAGDCLNLWSDLQRQDLLEESGIGWRLVRGAEFGLDYGVLRLTERIMAGGERDPKAAEEVRQTVAAAALEGRTFTADAVAAACGRSRDETVDLLDELASEALEDDTVFRELRAIEIPSITRDRSTYLWRYRFRRTLDWRVARDRFASDDPEAVCADLAKHLIDLYGPEVSWIAHVVAGLLARGGNPEEARFHARLAEHRVSEAVLQSYCERLLTIDVSGWTEHDFYNASELLVRGCWELQGTRSVEENILHAQRAEEMATAAGPRGGRGAEAAFCARGRFESHAGNPVEARRCLEEALEMSRQGSQSIHAEALRGLGELAWRMGPDLPAARDYLDRALEAFAKLGSTSGQGSCLSELAEIDRFEHDYESALRRNQEALEISDGARMPVDYAANLHQRARFLVDIGELDAGRQIIEDVLVFQRQRRRHADEAACLLILGLIELEEGRTDAARSHVLSALAIEEQIKKKVGQAECLRLLGELEAEAGKTAQARDYFARAVVLYEAIGDVPKLEHCARWLRDNSEG